MASDRHTYLVIGGGGFIGINLTQRLVAAGHRVRVFGHRSRAADALAGAEIVEGDLADTAALESALQGVDVAVHLANANTPHSANQDMAGEALANLVPALALMELCCKLKTGRLVFVSSGGTVYGNQATPTPETAPTEPLTAYGVSKLSLEKYLGLHEHLHGLNYRVLRLANPYGPHQVAAKNQGVISALIARALRKETVEIWGDGSVVRDFIFVDDVVDALIAAAEDRGAARIFNIGSGQGKSLLQVIAAIESLLGDRMAIRMAPGRALDVPVSVLDINRARTELGWSPRISFDDGLARTFAWWRANIGGR